MITEIDYSKGCARFNKDTCDCDLMIGECKHRDYKENILHMQNYERLIIEDVPGNTPREKHYNLQRMKQALQFWIHTFETHQEKISCVYDETGERFMPYNQLKQSKESLGLIKDDD